MTTQPETPITITQHYLLEVRNYTDGSETRDYLRLHVGAGNTFEVEWWNKPYRPFDEPSINLWEPGDRLRDALTWFTGQVVESVDRENGATT